MEKSVLIRNKEDLKHYREQIKMNLNLGFKNLVCLIETGDVLSVFQKMKFEKTAIEPLTGKPENLLEVVNQSHTYLVSIMGAEYLLKMHPDTSFRINFGNVSGYDIESEDGSIIAECFAATSYRSNGKLTADLKRLAENENARYKYEFFYDKEFTEKIKTYYQDKYPDIMIVKFQEIR